MILSLFAQLELNLTSIEGSKGLSSSFKNPVKSSPRILFSLAVASSFVIYSVDLMLGSKSSFFWSYIISACLTSLFIIISKPIFSLIYSERLFACKTNSPKNPSENKTRVILITEVMYDAFILRL